MDTPRLRMRSLGALLFLASFLAVAPGALAQHHPADTGDPPDEGWRGSVFIEGRAATGLDHLSSLSLWLYAAGAEWRAAPTLALRGAVLAATPVGSIREGEASSFGMGGELQLRMIPWPTHVVSPYAYWGLGLLLFPEVFLPGADHYEGLISFGLGADLRLADHWAVGLSCYYVHLSNGQGLGAHNPAYDGLGGGLTLSHAFAVEDPPTTTALDRRGGARPTDWSPGFILDLDVGRVDDATLATARLRMAQGLTHAVLAQLELEGGLLAEEGLFELGGTIAAHFAAASFGVRAAYRRFVTIDIPNATAQAELHLTPEASLIAMVHWEDPAEFDVLWRSALGFRAFPSDDFVLEIGAGFNDFTNDALEDTADPYLGIEWRLPLRIDGTQLSIFLERHVSTVDIVGLRGTYDAGASLRDTARHDAFRFQR